MKDIYFYEAFEEEVKVLTSLLQRDYEYDFTSITVQEKAEREPPARLISIRTQSKVPIEWSGKIEGVLSRSTGFDHLLDYQAAIRNPLPLGYLDEYASRAVAEHAMMIVMSLLRRLPQQLRQFPKFDRDGITGLECEGRNLLVVGVGRIGSEIVKIGRGLGFVVKGVDLVTGKAGISYTSRQEGIAWADVIICAMNLTRENRGYFSYDMLRSAKKGCCFVNIARGEHSPLADLARLLAEGRLGGLGLDVYENEGSLASALRSPAAVSVPQATLVEQLLRHPNVILTPHNAFNSAEALQRKSEMSVQQIRHFFQNKRFLFQV